MMGRFRWVALGMVAIAAALGLGEANAALADTSTVARATSLAFEEPQESQNGYSVSVVLASADGEPLTRETVDFFVVPDFFGERPVPLRSALTDLEGRATITYSPSWNGTHNLTARYGGNDGYQPGVAGIELAVSGLPEYVATDAGSLDAIRRWAAPGAVALAIAVWLVLAWIVFRVGWGISRAGRRDEEQMPASLAETGMEGLPGGGYR